MGAAALAEPMSDLFPPPAGLVPLAEQMRPQRIDDVVGQAHLVGQGKPLRLAVESGRPHSMILWGPPGVGKTTLARLLAHTFDAEFIELARAVYFQNDDRAAIKREINLKLGSQLIEEKSYQNYKAV